MNEQYITLVGKVCSPRYEEVYTPEVKSKLPIEASSEGRNLKDYTIYGNNNPNHVDESQSTLPVSIDTYGGNAEDWEIYGNNNPVIETVSNTLPIDISSSGGNAIDWTIHGNDDVGKNLISVPSLEPATDHGVTFTFDPVTGTITANGTATGGEARSAIYINPSETINVYLSGCPAGGSASSYNVYSWDSTAGARPKKWDGVTTQTDNDYGNGNLEVQLLAGHRVNITIKILQGYTANNLVFKPMIRKADTSEVFEPYTVGVGERTKNLVSWDGFDLTKYGLHVYSENGYIRVVGTYTEQAARQSFNVDVQYLEAGSYILSGAPDFSQYPLRLTFGRRNGSSYDNIDYDTGEGVQFELTEAADNIFVGIRCQSGLYGIPIDLTLPCMLRKADTTSTTSDFIPYGYQIPMQVKQRTENLFNKDAPYTASKYLNASGEEVSGATWGISEYIPIEGDTTYTTYNLNGGGASACWYDENKTYINGEAYSGATSKLFSLPSNAKYIRLTIRLLNPPNIDTMMLIKGNTAPEDYIPYYNIIEKDIYIGNSPLTQGQSITKAQSGQDVTLFSGDNIIDTSLYNKPETSITYNSSVLGVGEKTSNLYDKNAADTTKGYVLNKYLKYDGSTADNSVWIISEYINISGGSQIYLTYTDGTTTSVNASVAFYDSNHTFISGVKYNSQIAVSAPIPTNAKYCRFSILKANSGVAVLSLVSFSSYVPFGYQIPLLVTSGQQSTPHTIYIGDSPLTAGQSVNKTSSGADIALYQGNNTISTTLGNKPEMKIDYLSAEVGVGERTKNYVTWDNVDDTQYNVRCYGENGYLRLVGTYQSDTVHSPFRSYFQLPAGSYVLSGAPDFDELPIRLAMYTYVGGVSNYTTIGYDQGNGLSFTLTEDSNCFIGVRLQSGVIGVPIDLTLPCMVRPADTTSEFEPYGYKVPVKVYDDEDNSETYDVYIGSQLLVSGASVNKDGTGVDIELNEGVNTIKTDLYNEPEMYIK